MKYNKKQYIRYKRFIHTILKKRRVNFEHCQNLYQAVSNELKMYKKLYFDLLRVPVTAPREVREVRGRLPDKILLGSLDIPRDIINAGLLVVNISEDYYHWKQGTTNLIFDFFTDFIQNIFDKIKILKLSICCDNDCRGIGINFGLSYDHFFIKIITTIFKILSYLYSGQDTIKISVWLLLTGEGVEVEIE